MNSLMIDTALARLGDAALSAECLARAARVKQCERAATSLLVRYHAAMAEWDRANADLAAAVQEWLGRQARRN